MRWANYNGEKIEATKGAVGYCPSCEAELIPKCGEINKHHWSHRGGDCDSWSEPETRWHLNWKGLFPKSQQEVIVGEHRADVKTPHCVIEVQHSPIKPLEIREREEFYGDMIWVFDCRKQYKNEQIGWNHQQRYVKQDVFIWEVIWKRLKKSILTCRKPVLLHLERGRLLNIYDFSSYGFGLGHFVYERSFMEEVNGRLNTKESIIFPPDYVPTTREALEAQRLWEEQNREPTEEEIQAMEDYESEEGEIPF